MKRTLIAFLAAAAFATVSAPASANERHGVHEPTARLALDEGRKWSTDEALRRQMSELRDAVAYAQKRRLPADESRGLGDVVEYRVARIVDECRLPPAADANLHIVMAELIGAADALRDPAGAHPHAAVRRAALALNEYGRHFDHPGWKPLP